MRRIFVIVLGFSLIVAPSIGAPKNPESAEFQRKLSEMLARIEKSIQISRNQISENQSAPFLADLYVQLGELMSQKANALYYIKMEKMGGGEQKVRTDSKEFSPITEIQKEAIGIYKKVLAEFPSYPHREKILYLLTLGYKSVGEMVKFRVTAEDLFKKYPNTKQSMQARLLLGQSYFDDGKFKAAFETFLPVSQSKFAYERNLARYRIGLIYLRSDKHKPALEQFEKVIRDTEFTEEENETELSLEKREVKSNLKREALTDSVRAYTYVFAKNPDPLSYYSDLAPTETLFQEVIEKLAFRYINLKKYKYAVELLRSLSERIADPQKIVNIYQEVLLMIPLEERISIPIQETSYVLDKYKLWLAQYRVPEKVAAEAYNFFEKQTRDLGIRAHDLAKSSKAVSSPKKGRKGRRNLASTSTDRKQFYADRAEDYYKLYLGVFPRSKASIKVAMNLADVLFLKGDYIQSGEYYLRIFEGEYGAPDKNTKDKLIQNAILCSEKELPYNFYEQVKRRGILMASMRGLMDFKPEMKKNDRMNFVLVKASFEQGLYDTALDDLLGYMKRFPRSRYAVAAGEIILDHFNSRNDFIGLKEWSDKMGLQPIADKKFMRKVASISKSAELKILEEKAKETKDFDPFAQGRGYLELALASEDKGLKNTALQQALARSRAEKDFDTFLKTAQVMAERETDKDKKKEIRQSLVQENLKVTRFYEAIADLSSVFNDSENSNEYRRHSFKEAVNIALALKDFSLLEKFTNHSLWNELPPLTKSHVQQQVATWLDSPVELPDSFASSILHEKWDRGTLLSLYKARHRLKGNLLKQTVAQIQNLCKGVEATPVCAWQRMELLDRSTDNYERNLASTPPTVTGIEQQVGQFTGRLAKYQHLEQSGDPQLAMAVSIRTAKLFQGLAAYLNRVANANAELRATLREKAKEAAGNGKAYQDRCQAIARKAGLLSPTNKYCTSPKVIPISQMLEWEEVDAESNKINVADETEIENLRKNLFVGKNSAKDLLDISKQYLERGFHRHAAASASFGISLHKAQKKRFQTVLGCALTHIGMLPEANYHLERGLEVDGLKQKCLSKVQRLMEQL